MKHRTLLGLAILALPLAVGTGCAKPGQDAKGDSHAAEAEAFGRLTVDELDAKMAEAKAGKLALKIIDNNQKSRFEKSRIAGATWLASDDIKASDLPADKETTLVFYCANEH